tara:strand:- start:1043 stop:1270 length:228 start_codon:yes stop_codon:yes gene_type:complete
MKKVIIRKKRTFKNIEAHLYIDHPIWFKLGNIVIKDAQGDFMHCVTPTAFMKMYKSEDPDYTAFLKRAKDLYSDE